jgi:membrane-bound metal-dependent hydrolase YbcI (DUF457 family)
MLGLIVGKVTGSYEIAVGTSVLLDLDHILPLARHGLLKNFKTFWNSVTNPEDPYEDQRGVLHTFLAVFLTTVVSYFLFGAFVSMVLGISHLGHIVFDLLSDSYSWPFRPFSNLKTRGFVPYYSKYEVLFFLILLGVFVTI